MEPEDPREREQLLRRSRLMAQFPMIHTRQLTYMQEVVACERARAWFYITVSIVLLVTLVLTLRGL